MMQPASPSTDKPTTAANGQTIPDYPVKLVEFIVVGVGATAIVVFAVIEIANQFLAKIKNPEQAESIVAQVVEYEMPGGSQGLKSFQTNTEAFALVGNRRHPSSNLLLLVSQAPVEGMDGEVPINLAEELDIPSALVGTWHQNTKRVEQKQFCGKTVPVTIREGSYRLLEAPRRLVQMREYLVVQSQKRTQNSIQLFAIGPEAAPQLDRVFQSFKCPQPESR
ncbi:hypothetical protein IQ266_13765 [filamentous cyanobacterium LEGE 11480]|uniref:Uncharacterized protein n=2 Tax=Romeriopsis TaxID=2992131 RepID=A0A928Z3L2_9CYAN|nr:hypothetical protein [Romeriopsis navalis LEGE 11480]